MTYVLGAESQVPADVVLGKEVTIQVAPKEQGAVMKIKAKNRQQD